jgi:glutamate racemase
MRIISKFNLFNLCNLRMDKFLIAGMLAMGGTIGVFDSGVGGLSVLRHIRQTLPNERLIYVADSGHVPYGDKSPEYIEQRSLALARFLIEQGADAIVIACNTATAAAAAMLRSNFDIPIVAMEPAVKPAVAATRSGVVGVLATVGTLESARFAALLERYAGEVEIVTQGCPGLVEQVEQGDLAGAQTRELIARYTAPLLARGADTLVLGCTHYLFLAPLITEVVGSAVALVDTGEAVARQLQRRIKAELAAHPSGDAYARFFTSGETAQASRIMSALWGATVEAERLPPTFS